MRLPYLQLGEKFITTEAPMVAAMTGLELDSVIGKGVRLFAFVIDKTSTADKPPDGVLAFAEAIAVIEGIVGWTGAPGRLAEALVTAGTIERLEVGVRVRGCDRYKATWEKNRRRPAGRNRTGTGPEPDRLSTGTVPKPGRETETETETEEKREARAQTPPRSAAQHSPARVETDRPSSDPRASELLTGLAAVWSDEQPTVMRPDVPDVGSIRAFATQADPIPVPTLLAAYRLFLRDSHWQGAGWPWKAWLSQWKAKVTQATARAPKAEGANGRPVLRPVKEAAP